MGHGSNSGTLIGRRNPGKNLVEITAQHTVDTFPASFIELGANSYDADAERVDFEIDAKSGLATICDLGPGTGMSPTDVRDKFLRPGDSPKIEQPISPIHKRKRLGNRGIATLLLRHIGGAYRLVTNKDGVQTVVDEVFDGPFDPSAQIPINFSPTTEPNGTSIILSDLNFILGEQITLEQLAREIQWELPLLPDFRAYLNGDKITSKAIERATEIPFEATGQQMGSVHGSFYVTEGKKAVVPGIHVYVNGRRHGDPSTLFFSRGVPHSSRIVSIIHADGLEDAISFARRTFIRSHPAYLELQTAVREKLLEVRRYMDAQSRVTSAKKAYASRSGSARKAVAAIRGAKLRGVKRNVELTFEPMEGNVVGRYDANNGIVVANEQHPLISPGSAVNSQTYQALVVAAALHTIALSRTRETGGGLDDLESEVFKLWGEMLGEGGTLPEIPEMPLFDGVMYAETDLANHWGDLGLGNVRYLTTTGMLSAREDGKIRGADFSRILATTKGMVPIYEVVKRGVESSALTMKLRTLLPKIDVAGEAASPFIVDMNYGGQEPCYFVEGSCIEMVSELLLSRRLDSRRPKADEAIRTEFDELGSGSFTLLGLTEQLPGLGYQDIASVIDYASRNSLDLRTDTGGQSPTYHFRDFITALQHMRGNLNERQQLGPAV